MSLRVYLFRHGQTEFNAEGRLQGQLDSPLTPLGRSQAQRFGHALMERVNPEDVTILASPLGRVRETAEHLMEAAGLRNEIRFDPRLMELSVGEWEGLTEYDIDAQWPGALAGKDRYSWLFRAPGGETYEDLERRVTRVWMDIQGCPTSDCIVISHGVTGRVLRGLHGGLPRNVAMRLDAPQDAFFRLTTNACDRFDC